MSLGFARLLKFNLKYGRYLLPILAYFKISKNSFIFLFKMVCKSNTFLSNHKTFLTFFREKSFNFFKNFFDIISSKAAAKI